MKRIVWIVVIAVIVAGAAAVGARLWYRHTHSGPGGYEPSPGEFPLRGIDVSAHNGDIDFDAVAAQGFGFAVVKATEGTDFKDRNFVDNIRRARRAGLKVGAYHFFRFDTDGELQAANFMHSLRGRDLDLPAVIDVEEWGNPDGAATSHIVSRLRRMIDRLERYGYSVVLYTNKDAYERFVKGNFDNYPLWICSFTKPEPGLDWKIWQYSHRGEIDGVNGKVDLNTIKEEMLR